MSRIRFGVLCGICTSLFLVTTSSLVKLASVVHNPIDIFFYRSIGVLVLSFLVLVFTRQVHAIPRTNHKMQIIRAVFGAITMFCAFFCYTLLPIAQAQLFFFMSPLLIVALSYPLLKEKVGIYRTSAVVVGFIGMVIIMQPGTLASSLGALFGVGVTVFYAAVTLCLRFMGRTENANVTVFYFAAVSVLMALPFLPFYMVMPTPETLIYIGLIAFSSFGVQFCVTHSYKNAPAAVVAPLIYFNLVFALISDYMIWGVTPNPTILAGSIIIVGSNLFILWREHQKKLSPKPELS